MVSVPAMPLTVSSAPVLVATQGLIGVAFLVAAALAHRHYRRVGRVGDALLAAGLLIAAVSQVHGAIHPGAYTSIVTTADMLRLGFYGALLFGIFTDSRDDLRELREANVEVQRLAAAQAVSAQLEERSRIAREIHDGLAQDLWFAKLKQSRLAQRVASDEEATVLSDEVGGAIDAALAEARRAVVAMRPGAEPGDLTDMIARQVDDFSDRFAVRTAQARRCDARARRGRGRCAAARHDHRQWARVPPARRDRWLRAREHAAAGRAHRREDQRDFRAARWNPGRADRSHRSRGGGAGWLIRCCA
jgi:signal transduction histidine kinase